MQPTDTPLFTNLLAESWANKPPKPTALNTLLRYSGAYGCLRQMGYNAFDAEPTEPLSPAGAWAMGLGTIVHEAVQEAIAQRYPNAVFEYASQVNEFVSGSCDALVEGTEIGNVLYELKTMGTYGFDSQTGLKRGFGKLVTKSPEGPKQGAIVQAGMNALGIEAMEDLTIDYLVLGSLTFETVSVKMVRQVPSLADFARFGAEWHIPRGIWEPLTRHEIDRLTSAGEAIDLGYLPDRWARDDDGADVLLDPLASCWQCDYCAFKQLCADDRGGQVRVLDSHLVKLQTKEIE